MIIHTAPQGSQEWLDARRGVITGSRFKDCRDRLKNGNPSKACTLYAMDVARERCGGRAMETYQNAVQYGETTSELSQAMSNLVADDYLYSSMKNLGLSQVQKYSLANRLSQYKAIFDHLCA